MATKKTDNKQTPPQKPDAKKAQDKIEEKMEKPAEKTTAQPASKPSEAKKSLNIFMIVILLIIAGGIYLYQKGHITKYYPIAKSKFTHHSPLNNDDAFTKLQKETQGLTPPEPTTDTMSKSTQPEDQSTETAPVEKDQVAVLMETVAKLQSDIEALKAENINTSNQDLAAQNQAASADKNLFMVIIKNVNYSNILARKVMSGKPFTKEFDQLATHLDKHAKNRQQALRENLSRLEEFKKIGVPSPHFLTKTFERIAHNLQQKEALKNAETVLDKTKIFVSQLVHIKKKTETKGENKTVSTDPNSLDYKIDKWRNALHNGDVSAMITDLENHLNESTPPSQKKDEKIARFIMHAKAFSTATEALVFLQDYIFDEENF